MAKDRRQPEFVGGTVTSAGLLTAASVDGVTAIKENTGVYRVTLPAGMRLVSAQAALNGIGAFNVGIDQMAERSFRVGVVSAAGAATDGGFLFMAMGVQQ